MLYFAVYANFNPIRQNINTVANGHKSKIRHHIIVKFGLAYIFLRYKPNYSIFTL